MMTPATTGMIETSCVLVEDAEGVRTITLNRPQAGNALNSTMVQAVLAALEGREGIKLVVFRGSGRNFCTGFDLSDLETSSDGDLLLRFVQIESLLQAVQTLDVPSIAFATGRAFGAGADLFAVCDIRLATSTTSFSFPGPRFGLVLGSRRLAGITGRDRAREILLQSKTIDVSEGVVLGLVHGVLDEGEIAEAIATQLASADLIDPITKRQIKAAMADTDLDQDLANLVRSASRPGLKARIAEYSNLRRAEFARSRPTSPDGSGTN
jgi:enoyl-CoA hydratase/carnithine racemase